MSGYVTINTAAEFFCLLVSIPCLIRDKEKAWRMLMPYLTFTCLAELAGIYIRNVLHRPNFMLYNAYTVVECLVGSCFFYYLLHRYRYSTAVLIGWLVLFSICSVTELYFNHFGNFIYLSTSLMSVGFILAGAWFFYAILQQNEYVHLTGYAPFWWVSGMLCFHFGSIVCDVFFNYLVHDKTPVISYSVRYIVFNILNVIYYFSFSYAFICRYRQRTSSSSLA